MLFITLGLVGNSDLTAPSNTLTEPTMENPGRHRQILPSPGRAAGGDWWRAGHGRHRGVKGEWGLSFSHPCWMPTGRLWPCSGTHSPQNLGPLEGLALPGACSELEEECSLELALSLPTLPGLDQLGPLKVEEQGAHPEPSSCAGSSSMEVLTDEAPLPPAQALFRFLLVACTGPLVLLLFSNTSGEVLVTGFCGGPADVLLISHLLAL